MAWARTVAVVVPSPATSQVLRSDFAHHLGAHVFQWVLQFDFLGHGHAVLGDGGDPNFLSITTLRPFGSERHLDGSASYSRRAKSPDANLLHAESVLPFQFLLQKEPGPPGQIVTLCAS